MPILTRYLKVFVSFLLLVAHPALSFPRALDNLNQDAASLSFPSNPLCDHHLKNSHCEERLPRQPTRHKRAGRVAQGSAITLHAFQAATYIGARAVLERLYTQILVDATQRAAGTTTPGPEYECGDVCLSFLTSNDGIPWDIIRQFADMMLTRVLNGDQNFYIADVVYDVAGVFGAGQGSFLLLMGTPDTEGTLTSARNLPWAQTAETWLRSKGLA